MRWFNRLKLQQQLLFLFITIGLVPLVVISLVNSAITINVLREQVTIEETLNLDNTAEGMVRFFDTSEGDLLILAQSTSVRTLAQNLADGNALTLRSSTSQVETDFINLIEQRIIADTIVYEEIRFLDSNGTELIRVESIDNRGRPTIGFNLNSRSNRAYYIEARDLEPQAIYRSPVQLAEEFGIISEPYEPVIHYSTPIYHNDERVGVLVLDVRASGFLDLAQSSSSAETIAFLVDEDGYYLSHPNADKLYGRELGTGHTLLQDFPELSQFVTTSNSGTIDLDTYLSFFTRIVPDETGQSWVLVALHPTSSIFAPITQQVVTLLVGLILVIVLVIALAILVANSIGRPIFELTKGVQQIASGNFGTSIQTNQQNEIGTLATVFNQMSDELGNVYSTLEQRVEERTAQLVTARKEAERANQAKSEFLSNMSHELRTPLNVLIGYSNAILHRPNMFNNMPLPMAYKPYIKLIEESGHYLLGLINDVLDLSKIEAGHLELNCTTVQLNDLVDAVIATGIGLVKDKPIQISSQVDSDFPLLWADKLRLRQILLNLVSNAVKFTDTGSVTITAHQNQQYASIAVTDTGQGIPEDALHNIFDRFTQLAQGQQEGTGLGLDIMEGIFWDTLPCICNSNGGILLVLM
ncbi:MAG: ATP-binding protein, partial [Chloroflexota bacterium]